MPPVGRCYATLRRTSSEPSVLVHYKGKNNPTRTYGSGRVILVPLVGLEPTRRMSPLDFESSASASFTTAAFSEYICCKL